AKQGSRESVPGIRMRRVYGIGIAMFCLSRIAPTETLFPYTTLFRSGGATCDDKSAQIYARFDKNDWRIQPAEFYRSAHKFEQICRHKIGRAVQQECRDRPRMPSSA